MEFKDLTAEQKARAKEAKSAQELVEMAQSEGVEPTDEQLEAIAGGGDWYTPGL